jgi:hypothetical protein
MTLSFVKTVLDNITQFFLLPGAIDALIAGEHKRFNDPIPLIRRRMKALRLKSQGIPHKKVDN